MEKFVWWVEYLTPQGDWSSVLMECGVESVMLSSTGVLTMPEWCAGSWGSLKRVRFHMFILTNKHLLLLCTGAYVLDFKQRFGTSERSAVIGEVHCVGTEPELLKCSHASIGSHRCGINTDYSDIIISCYGRWLSNALTTNLQ